MCGLCGLDPVLAALGAAAAMGATRGELIAEATSADVPGGDPRRVVGYAAVAFVA
ncbi:MAG: AmmeMemoRadiSam system protein B [Chloroflexi bacterium GWC2_73_18]|nr:MAG: AmmeMemoRadiSam system protein B [Chloroflexi bacterium GWC2_73_18]